MMSLYRSSMYLWEGEDIPGGEVYPPPPTRGWE